MRGRDQWVLVQAVIDHLGHDDHASSLITERKIDLEWPQDARNYRKCWSAEPVPKLVEDSTATNPGHGHFLPVGWMCQDFLLRLMHLTRCGLDESHNLKLPCEEINSDGAGIFL
jgi:hypothetical protein